MADRVFVRVHAGLGNQLFQYAMGRAAASRNNCELLLDLRDFRRAGAPLFSLHHFKVRYGTDEAALPPVRRQHRLHHFIWRTFGLSPRRVLQRGNGFDSEALARAGTYLEGYWQSERYFQDIEPTIREELQFANAPDPENAALLDDIAGRPAISLHVRRGDYLLPKHQLMYAGCSLEYYRNAVDFIAASANIDPVVYVFSDDPEWARDSLQLKAHTRIVSHNGVERAHEDLRLMSACRHHIIANSTFSWWGAWLNASPDKIVVAPKTWTLDPAIYNPDILPASWRAMENTKPQAAGVS